MSPVPAKQTPAPEPTETVEERFRRLEATWLAEVGYSSSSTELRSHPGFESAALTNRFRMIFSGSTPIEIEGHTYQTDSDRPDTNFEQVSDGYFQTLGARLLEGRDFRPDESLAGT